ncbi:cytochrome P450 [Streptosporangium sp. NPDC020145]|uniref:cytochrome P450 n=1 Tax=Streptosporangium sp. NPDC020145 TaxID=3154694 RepID=UPI0034424143
MDRPTARTFPIHRPDPYGVPAELAELRGEPPCRLHFADGEEHWVLSRHADVRAVLADPRISADDRLAGFPQLLPGAKPGELSFTRMDDPEHGRLRRMLTSEFSVPRVETMRPTIEGVVDGLLDDLEKDGGPADLVRRFALPVPTLVICGLLGVPYEDHAFFQTRSAAILSSNPPEVAGPAFAEIAVYLDRLLTDREREPKDDLLSRIAARVNAGELTHDEALGMARVLLIAGHETTANALALSVLTLLDHPGQLAELRADPALVRPAVAELLRFLTITQGPMARMATAPLEVGGVTVQAGEGVVLSLLSANRDERAFPEPDRLDLRRDPRFHVAFGFGPHQCLGQNLARVELEVAISRLFARFPGLALARPVEELGLRVDSVIYGVRELPVTW